MLYLRNSVAVHVAEGVVSSQLRDLNAHSIRRTPTGPLDAMSRDKRKGAENRCIWPRAAEPNR